MELNRKEADAARMGKKGLKRENVRKLKSGKTDPRLCEVLSSKPVRKLPWRNGEPTPKWWTGSGSPGY
jgi:hypothetical protein